MAHLVSLGCSYRDSPKLYVGGSVTAATNVALLKVCSVAGSKAVRCTVSGVGFYYREKSHDLAISIPVVGFEL